MRLARYNALAMTPEDPVIFRGRYFSDDIQKQFENKLLSVRGAQQAFNALKTTSDPATICFFLCACWEHHLPMWATAEYRERLLSPQELRKLKKAIGNAAKAIAILNEGVMRRKGVPRRTNALLSGAMQYLDIEWDFLGGSPSYFMIHASHAFSTSRTLRDSRKREWYATRFMQLPDIIRRYKSILNIWYKEQSYRKPRIQSAADLKQMRVTFYIYANQCAGLKHPAVASLLKASPYSKKLAGSSLETYTSEFRTQHRNIYDQIMDATVHYCEARRQDAEGLDSYVDEIGYAEPTHKYQVEILRQQTEKVNILVEKKTDC